MKQSDEQKLTLTRDWWKENAADVPRLITATPGPRSKEMHARAARYMKGLSSQVKLFPVCFEEGYGVTLTDVDGNRYLDFSSGIYVTSLGHCHPKISEAIAYWAKKLMNAHDFTTPVKEKLLEKMAGVLPGNLNAIQLYSDGASAVEAAIRAARAITGKHEFISGYRDFHGKSMAAVSCAQMIRGDVYSYGPTRAPGFYMVPRPDPYRPLWTRADGTIDTDQYIAFYDQFITESTVGNVAAFVLEPAQGWAGSIFPPDDFFPKLKAFCEKKKILLFDDEVLAGMGRTGEYLCMNHWNVEPDIVTLGKSFGNGFPVTAMVLKEEYGEALESISASSSYGGNPMACAAALASIEVIEEEGLLENVRTVGAAIMKRLEKMKAEHPIIGDVKGKGFLLGIELVRDKITKEPFAEAGTLVYQKAFQRGLAWIPAGHILRMSPPLIMDETYAMKGIDMIEDAISDVEKQFGYV
ncbi:aspartate aminotransferase family protein [Niabella drilacis]|uniref:4-aminobutyrate aminotransferase / (S)-3-amino-2-methylpropionate transaminase n=1 Tax=Niabella drilacis (strain DSM 25811 / CCM 8410 / CCUG 62505 / LMG 26954 / E90) TaxID=1285928 RepID=A0A1G6LUQ2_NIADE|nr:aspartate aminotransferase family protein [Niabella drilacis]SDC46951.1 4-aminobutyrate aminotransferase / (S)-3-amino-2-methylpropionate transaminase [Niabella drilacis]